MAMVGAARYAGWRRKNAELLTVKRSEVDLRDQAAVFLVGSRSAPQVVFLAAAKVGGIVANNTLRAEFIYDNLIIATNVIHAAHTNGAEKLMFLGSSCIYPKLAPPAAARGFHADGRLNRQRAYAIAKIAGNQKWSKPIAASMLGLHQCDADQSVRARRQLSPEYSHVVAALIRPVSRGKAVGHLQCRGLGTGNPAPGNSSTSTTWRTPACT